MKKFILVITIVFILFLFFNPQVGAEFLDKKIDTNYVLINFKKPDINYFTYNLSDNYIMHSKSNKSMNNEEKLNLKVEINSKKIKNSKDLKVKLQIINNTNKNLILKFNSSQKYDIKLKNEFGDIVYSWQKNKFFIQSFRELKIKHKDSITFKENIKLNKFEPGIYILDVNFLATNYDFKIIKKELKIY